MKFRRYRGSRGGLCSDPVKPAGMAPDALTCRVGRTKTGVRRVQIPFEYWKPAFPLTPSFSRRAAHRSSPESRCPADSGPAGRAATRPGCRHRPVVIWEASQIQQMAAAFKVISPKDRAQRCCGRLPVARENPPLPQDARLRICPSLLQRRTSPGGPTGPAVRNRHAAVGSGGN